MYSNWHEICYTFPYAENDIICQNGIENRHYKRMQVSKHEFDNGFLTKIFLKFSQTGIYLSQITVHGGTNEKNRRCYSNSHGDVPRLR